jgi:hypothetical protein
MPPGSPLATLLVFSSAVPFTLTLINGRYHTVKFILIGLLFALIG